MRSNLWLNWIGLKELPTFIEERFSFEVHRKSYSRWKKCTFDLGLRKFSNMFDFPNFQLKIHHDTSFKWKSVQHESCSPWSHLSKMFKIISFGSKLKDLRMGAVWGTIWKNVMIQFNSTMHGLMQHLQHDMYIFLDLCQSFFGLCTHQCKHAYLNFYFWHLNGSV